jgi:transcriptional regulator with XRE-family HTH domain
MPLLRRIIGSVLRRVRQRQGRTLKEVAAVAGVSLPYLSEVERGTKEASSEILAAICRALGLPMTDLLDLVRQEMLSQMTPRAAHRRVPVARISAPVRSRTPGATCSVSRLRSAGGRPRTRLACARRAARLIVTC